MANEQQIRHWAGEGGERWVADAERYDHMLRPYGERLVEAVGPTAGLRILDVGCGNGSLTVELAGDAASVVGVDISSPMLAEARRRADAAGRTNVTLEEADAQVHRFEPASFDLVVSRFGVMFFDDPAAAFANLAAALAPGGRMVFVCWRDLAVNDWLMRPALAAMEHLPPPTFPPPGSPGPFALADPERLRALLDGAGLVGVELGAVDERNWMGATVAEALGAFQGVELTRVLTDGAPEDAVARAWVAVAELLETCLEADGVYLDGRAWLVTAGRP